MISILISGGLGNQLFQLSLARRLSSKRQNFVLLDASVFRDENFEFGRKLEIETLAKSSKIDITIGSAKDIERDFNSILSSYQIRGKLVTLMAVAKVFRKYGFVVHPRYSRGVSDLLFLLPFPHLLIPGNFDLRWIDDDLMNQIARLSTKSDIDLDFAENPNWVGVHVRRGDYAAESSIHQLQPVHYFHKAMAEFISCSPKSKFLVFSDDVEWCRNNLDSTKFDLTFIRDFINPDPLVELSILSQLDKLIISNSTFSLFAAYTNSKNKTVIYPNKWFVGEQKQPFKFPRTWVKC